MIAVDDMLVDALPPEVLQNLVDAVDAIQNGLEEQTGGERRENIPLLLIARFCMSYIIFFSSPVNVYTP